MNREIQYLEKFNILEYRKCRKAFENIVEGDFDSYRELFERCFVEKGIMTGQLGSIRPVSLEHDPYEDTEFGKLMGVNQLCNNRISWAKEFFDLYEACGRSEFLRHRMYETTYYKETFKLLSGNACGLKGYLVKLQKLRIRKLKYERKIINILLNMYENMKIANGLVASAKNPKGNNKEWYYYDFPWAIDYFGYIKKRDGSHRRMIAKYLGLKEIDTIVVDFASLTKEDLKDSLPYLGDNFEWFYTTVKKEREKINL